MSLGLGRGAQISAGALQAALGLIQVPWTSLAPGRTPITWDTQTGTITPNNNETHIPGGKSIYFNTGILVDNSNLVGNAIGTGDFTIEMWFRRSGQGTQSFMYFGQSDQEVALMRDEEISWYTNTGGVNCQGGNAPQYEWHHLCFQRTGNTIRCYIDGVNRASGSATPTSLANGTFTLGGQKSNGQLIRGYMQELRISKVARYGSSFTPPTTPHADDPDTLLLLHGNSLADDAPLITNTNYQEQLIAPPSPPAGARDGVYTGIGLAAAVGNSDTHIPGGKSIKLGHGVRIKKDIPAGPYYTYEGWFKFDTLTSMRVFMGSSGRGDLDALADGRFRSDLGSTSAYGGSYTTNTWMHIAMVREHTGLYTYINGVRTISAYGPSNAWTDPQTKTIGGHPNSTSYESVLGNVQELRISNVARYTSDFTPHTTPHVNDGNTVLLLHGDSVDDDNTTTLVPSRSTYNHTTAVGGVSVDNSLYRGGFGSLHFDGTGYLDTGLSTTGSDIKTIELWFYSPSSRTAQYSNELIGRGQYNSLQLVHNNSNNLTTSLAYVPNNSNNITNGHAATANEDQWNHWAYTFDGIGVHKLYLNGVRFASISNSNAMNDTANTNWIIGGSTASNTSNFMGNIDSVRFSSSVRYEADFNPDEIEFDNDANTLLLIDGNENWADQLGVADVYVSPPFSLDASTISASTTEAVEGDTITYTIHLKNGGGGAHLDSTIAPTASANTGTVSTPAYQGNGEWTFTYTRSNPGTSTITVDYMGNTFPTETIVYASAVQPPAYIGKMGTSKLQTRDVYIPVSIPIQNGDLLVVNLTVGASNDGQASADIDSGMSAAGWTKLYSRRLYDNFRGVGWSGYKIYNGSNDIHLKYTNAASSTLSAVVHGFRGHNGNPVVAGTFHGNSSARSSNYSINLPGRDAGYYAICSSHMQMHPNFYNNWYFRSHSLWDGPTDTMQKNYGTGYRSNVLSGIKYYADGSADSAVGGGCLFTTLSSTYSGYTDNTAMTIQVW